MEEIKTARAQAKFVRIAPRKVQIICDMIRGKDAAYAEALMANTPKAGCEHVIKVLKSAVALGRPVVIDVQIPIDDKVYPMVAPGASISDMMGFIDMDSRN